MSNRQTILQREKLSKIKRPWAVMFRWLRSSGAWTPWRVHGTYASDTSANIGAVREIENWSKSGIPCETRVIAPGESRKIE